MSSPGVASPKCHQFSTIAEAHTFSPLTAPRRPQRTIGAKPTQHLPTATCPSQKARRLLIAKQSAARARVEVVGSGITVIKKA